MTNRTKFPVARRACLSCREKKIKCDGEKVTIDQATNKVIDRSTTVCSNCKSLGIDCVFVKSKRGGQRARKPKARHRSAPAIADLIESPVSNFKPSINRISTNIKVETSSEGQPSPSDTAPVASPRRLPPSHSLGKTPAPYQTFFPPSFLPGQDMFPPPMQTVAEYVPAANYGYPPVSVSAYSFHTYLPRPPVAQFSQPYPREGHFPMPMLTPPMIAAPAANTNRMMPFQPLFVGDASKLRHPSPHNAPRSKPNAPVLLNDPHVPPLANANTFAPPGRK